MLPVAYQTIQLLIHTNTDTYKYSNTDKLKFIYISNAIVLSSEINFPFSNSPDFKEHSQNDMVPCLDYNQI